MKNKHNSKEGSLVRYCTFLLCYRFGRDVLLNGGPIISVGFCLSVKKRGYNRITIKGLFQFMFTTTN